MLGLIIESFKFNYIVWNIHWRCSWKCFKSPICFISRVRIIFSIQLIQFLKEIINTIICIQLNPIKPGLFSRSPGPGGGEGGSEARMPKIKVTIYRLKWNFAWVIIAIKACLMQNLSLVAFLFLEIWGHKFSPLWSREWVTEFNYLPPENELNLKRWAFMSRIVIHDPKLTPMSISAISNQKKIFSFPKLLRRLDEKKAGATSIDQFC